MKEKILQKLKNAQDYVSGQELCEAFGVSRTAVWKNIKSLKEDGYQIDSVNNRGYRLVYEPELVDEIRIRSFLETKWMGQNLIYEKQVDSTNTQAKRLGETDAPNGTLVVTECQTAGKGRRGRVWESPEGNIYFTILLRPDLLADRASMITLVAALAVSAAIYEVADLDTMIKWPNDIIANGKKLCGILTESSTDLEYINYLVVGIGINCNQIQFPKEIADMASSICLECGEEVDRAKLVGCFLNHFEKYYETFLETEDLSKLVEDYNARLVNCGNEVKIIERDRERVMKALGIDSTGGLLVENQDGTRECIISGEVSVRGLYGYV